MLHTSRAYSSHARAEHARAPRAGGPLEPSMLEHTSPLGSSMLEHNRVIPCAISRDLVDSNYINPASFSLLSPFLFHLPSQSPPESQNLHTHHAHLSSTITNSPSCLSIVENSRAYPSMPSQLEYAQVCSSTGYLEQSMLVCNTRLDPSQARGSQS